ncbi:MAG: DUF2934 domain-containing protein [Candidatus Thiodiazotropha sp.]
MVKKPEDETEKKVTKKKAASKKKSVAKKKVTTKKTAASKKKSVAKKKVTTKKTAAKKSTAKPATSSKPKISPRERYEMIATMAYYRAEARNFEPGYDVDDWLECEKFIDDVLK